MLAHVVDWLTGDHDGNAPNFLVLEGSGAPVRIDRGQAFKFLGQDRLSLDYEPNKQHGAPPHAAIALYRAAKAGKLKVNPHLLLPVIEAVEKITDEQYRAALAPAAQAGAKSDAHWKAFATGEAAKKLGGKRAPKETEVAEAFLTAATERKHHLRREFEGFFEEVLGVLLRRRRAAHQGNQEAQGVGLTGEVTGPRRGDRRGPVLA